VAVVGAIAACTPPAPADDSSPPIALLAPTEFEPSVRADSVRVVLVGDSIATELAHFLRPPLADAGLTLEVNAFGGTAACDWYDGFEIGPGDVLVLSFIGNGDRPCARVDGRLRSPEELVELFRWDLTQHTDRALAAGATVALVGQPPVSERSPYVAVADGINAAAADLAASRDDVVVIDAGATLRTRAGAFTEWLAPLPEERDRLDDADAGRVRVRNADGVHLCPTDTLTDGEQGRCPTWSSGAWRMATALARALGATGSA
jgi:hypothetical protein